MTSITRFVLHRKRLVVGLWVLIALAAFASLPRVSKSLSKNLTVPGREGFVTNQAILHTFHDGGLVPPIVPVVTVPAGHRVDAPGSQAQLQAALARVHALLPGARIVSYPQTRDPGFLSADRRTTFALVYPPPAAGQPGENPEAARAVTRVLATSTVDGAPIQVTGIDALMATTHTGGSGPGVVVEVMIGALGALAVLAFVFASLIACLPLLIALVSIPTTFLLILGLTNVTSVNSDVQFLVALIGLGVAIDYALLIVVRWREERTRTHTNEQAVMRAMQTAGRAVAFSGVTVALGLLSLIVLPLPFLRSVGYAGMLIPLVSVAVAVTLLPVVLATIAPRLDWPHVRSDRNASPTWSAWARLVVRRRWLAAGSGAAVLVVLALAAGNIQPGSPRADSLASSGPARTALRSLEQTGIGSGVLTPFEALQRGGDPAVVAAALSHVAGVRAAIAPDAPGWWVGDTALMAVLPQTDGSSAAGRATLSRVRAAAHRLAPPVRIGGPAAQNADFIAAVHGSFPLMLALITVLTFVLLARAFRSIVLPLKAILVNLLSVAAAWGVITLVWQEGHGSELIWGIPATRSITAWLPLMVYAFLFGLSMDYEVFILSRIREEYDRTGTTGAAVIAGIGRTGRLVSCAALILFLAFVSLGSGPRPTSRSPPPASALASCSTLRSFARCWCPRRSRSSIAGTGGSPPHRRDCCAPPPRPVPTSGFRPAQSEQTVADRRPPRMFTALAALTALAILLQAVLAGQFVDRTGRGGWINAHAINADVVLALAILTAAYSLATMRRSAHELAIGSAVLAVLVIIQLVIGHAITHQNADSLIAIHIPLAMAIFGLSVWLNVRPARQHHRTARSNPTVRANDRARQPRRPPGAQLANSDRRRCPPSLRAPRGSGAAIPAMARARRSPTPASVMDAAASIGPDNVAGPDEDQRLTSYCPSVRERKPVEVANRMPGFTGTRRVREHATHLRLPSNLSPSRGARSVFVVASLLVDPPRKQQRPASSRPGDEQQRAKRVEHRSTFAPMRVAVGGCRLGARTEVGAVSGFA